MRNPNCVSCELRCDLTAVKTSLTTALAEVGSPVAEAQLGVEVAQYDRDQDLVDEELREMVGQTGFNDPDSAFREAEASLAAAEAVTAAYDELLEAQHVETRSSLLNEGPRQIRAVDSHLTQLHEWCPGQRRGLTLPLIGFVALGFGPSSRCGSPRGPLARATLANIRNYILPQ
jgi:hypothetical protein